MPKIEELSADIPTKVKSRALVEKRREQIVIAAIKLFSQKGFHKTTLRELAEEAGISHGNIYDYITNKEDIFFLVHDFMHGVANDIINQSIKSVEDPVEKLRRIIRGEFNIMYNWADAVLLIYQETHILGKPLLYKLLEKERKHVERIEAVLKECMDGGQIRAFNIRAAANLIRSMVESWVVKRWDLRGEINRLEMEKSVLDVLFNGIGVHHNPVLPKYETDFDLQGKTALIINSRTCLGNSIAAFLAAKGLRLVLYEIDVLENKAVSLKQLEASDGISVYTADKSGELTIELFRKILEEAGPVDFIIHDVGINFTKSTPTEKKHRVGNALVSNLRSAENLAAALETDFAHQGSGPILYLAPWGWDYFADPFRFEIVRQGTINLAKVMARRMATKKVNVNCLVPGFISGIKPFSIEKQKGDEVLTLIPKGELGELSDVLEAVYFLISDSAKYISGQILEVSGGMVQNCNGNGLHDPGLPEKA